MTQPFYTTSMAAEAGYDGKSAIYFATFMNAANEQVVEATGLTIEDFPDWDWADAFDTYLPINQIVENFLRDVQKDAA